MERLVRAVPHDRQTITLTMAACGVCGLERLTVDFESMSGLTSQRHAQDGVARGGKDCFLQSGLGSLQAHKLTGGGGLEALTLRELKESRFIMSPIGARD